MKKELRGFVFYAQDYFGDAAVRLMPTNLRMVWVEAFFLMSLSPRKGVLLKKNGEPYSVIELARLINTTPEEVTAAIEWVHREGIASTDRTTKTLMNRRMVRDENRSKNNRKNGKLGGNPLLVGDSNQIELVHSLNRPDKAKPEPDPEPIKTNTPLEHSSNRVTKFPSQDSAPVEKRPEPPRDLASDVFCAKCREATSVPYKPDRGEFVMLAKLRTLYRISARQLPPNWEQACENYFASPLGQYSLSDLANPKRYAVFVNSPVDQYGKPLAHINRSNGSGIKTKTERTVEAAQRLSDRLDRQAGERDERGVERVNPERVLPEAKDFEA